MRSGRLVRAVTRGNGVEGDDVTANALTHRTLPRELKKSKAPPVPDLIEIRGEIYLTLREFQRINREREEAGLEPYANPRNLAAGTLKQLDRGEVARRRLEIVLYGAGASNRPGRPARPRADFHAQMRAWGLPTVEKFWPARGIDAGLGRGPGAGPAAHELRLRDGRRGGEARLPRACSARRAARARRRAGRWPTSSPPERAETRLAGHFRSRSAARAS